MATAKENIKKLDRMIENKEKTQDIRLTAFLLSNARKDRDSLIKVREQILTIKVIKDELF